jgi:hypothetical protein
MSDLRLSLRLCRLQFTEWLHKPIIPLGLLLGCNFVINAAREYGQALASIGGKMQVAEPFIMIGSSKRDAMFILLGLFVMLSDVPFINALTPSLAMKTSRRAWIRSIILYIAGTCLIYYSIIMFAAAVVGIKYSYLGNIWSMFMVQAAYGGFMVNGHELYFLSALFLKVFTPYQGLLITLGFQVTYAFILCMIMLLFSIKYNRGIGVTVSIVIHAMGSDIIAQGLGGNPYLSPLLRSLPAYHRIMPHEVLVLPLPTLLESGIMWALLAIGTIIFASVLSRRYDFPIPNKQI